MTSTSFYCLFDCSYSTLLHCYYECEVLLVEIEEVKVRLAYKHSTGRPVVKRPKLETPLKC